MTTEDYKISLPADIAKTHEAVGKARKFFHPATGEVDFNTITASQVEQLEKIGKLKKRVGEAKTTKA